MRSRNRVDALIKPSYSQHQRLFLTLALTSICFCQKLNNPNTSFRICMEKIAFRLSKEKIYSVKTKMLNQQPPQRQAQLMTLHACLSYSASLRHFSCIGLSLPPYTISHRRFSALYASVQSFSQRLNIKRMSFFHSAKPTTLPGMKLTLVRDNRLER